MYKYFGDWYRIAVTRATPEELERRDLAIQELLKDLAKSVPLSWVAILLDLRDKDSNTAGSLAQVFQKHDPSFPLKKNKVALQVLTGIAIAEYIETNSGPNATTLALATLCGAFWGMGKPLIIPDILPEVHSFLQQRSNVVRKLKEKVDLKCKTLNAEETSTAFTSALASGDTKTATKVFIEAIKQSPDFLKGLPTLATQVRALQEQTEMLWWLNGEFSEELEKPYRKIESPVACLVGAKELADRTAFSPGPIAIPALLSKILGKSANFDGKMSVEDAVNSTPKDWRIGLIEHLQKDLLQFLPIHHAILKSTETRGKKQWLAGFKGATKIDPAKSLDAFRLAAQFYNERLLAMESI